MIRRCAAFLNAHMSLNMLRFRNRRTPWIMAWCLILNSLLKGVISTPSTNVDFSYCHVAISGTISEDRRKDSSARIGGKNSSIRPAGPFYTRRD
jgi:hypothetical protein